MTRLASVPAALAALAFCLSAHAAPPGFPAYLTLEGSLKVAGDGPRVESYAQSEFQQKEGTQIFRGKKWDGYLIIDNRYGDERATLPRMLGDLKKGGWKTIVKDVPRNPPLGVAHRKKDGVESWVTLEGGSDQMHVTLIEIGEPTVKLELKAPTAGIEGIADTADFPFATPLPGARLAQTSKDERPFLVVLVQGQEPAQVASGSVIKEYKSQAGMGGYEIVVVHKAALAAAGWTIVEENTALTTGDPNLTAHFVKGPLELWLHVHSGDSGYTVTVADASAERASSKLKAELDKACKVAIYGVHFDFDKATLRDDSEAALQNILAVLTDFPELKVELGGHTDNVGERDYNMKLSKARAKAVVKWLVRKGIKAERLTAKGYADTQPVADNDGAGGRAKNRRVEMKKTDCGK